MHTQTSPTPDTAADRVPDALELLHNEHKELEALFKLYEFGRDRFLPGRKQELAEILCRALKTHAIMEEEIFYPAIEDRIADALSLVAEARVEQNVLKVLIADIETGMPGSIEYDADVKVLGEYVRHHIADEERSLVTKVREARFDLSVLGKQLLARKTELINLPDKEFADADVIFGGGLAG